MMPEAESESRDEPELTNQQRRSLVYLGYRTMAEMISGTLDLLILRVLSAGPLHGFGIGERIHLLSKKVLEVEEGSLYPALYRMEAKGWIRAEWGQSERGRKAKIYSLTRPGWKQLESEQASWNKAAVAIGDVLKNAGAS